jgi:gallate dioxygenase
MARILGGIAVSHTPTIGFAHDHGKAADPAWKPIFDALAPAKAWLAAQRPDALVLTYNDHVTSFFFDHYSPFALGIGERFEPADEGGGVRALPPLFNHTGLAHHIAASLFADEFDLATFQDKPLDHGCFSPLSVLCDHDGAWPMRVVPLQMGVLQFPIPTPRRFWRLGQALRRAIESFEEDLRVVLVATGGLSHQVHGERAGFNNPQWDERFLDLFERDPEALTRLTQAEYATLGGLEGAEVVMWLTMRGALPALVRKVHQAYALPSMTGIACAVYEAETSAPVSGEMDRERARIGRQLAGAEGLPGTYPFDLARSVKGYRLNRFLHGLIEPQARAAFLADEARACARAGLSSLETRLVRERDWMGLIHYGAIFFVLEKLAAVSGLSNLHVYAHMRGQSLEAFLATRNSPSAIYSVAAASATTGDFE